MEVADMKLQLAAEQSHVEALTAANATALKPPRDRAGLIALWRRAVLHASAGPKIRDTNINDNPYPYSGSFSAVSKPKFASKY